VNSELLEGREPLARVVDPTDPFKVCVFQLEHPGSARLWRPPSVVKITLMDALSRLVIRESVAILFSHACEIYHPLPLLFRNSYYTDFVKLRKSLKSSQ
jgi:hypothetical protein